MASRHKFKRAKAAPEKRAIVGYRKLLRIVDGGIMDVVRAHPHFFANAADARRSIGKHIVGNLISFLAQARRGRPGSPIRRLKRTEP